MDLNNKYIMLTGATGGIGQAIAIELAQAGANLILVGRQLEQLHTLQDHLASLRADHSFTHILADLSGSEGINVINELALKLATKGEAVDVLINCAGINQFQFFSQRSQVSLRQEFEVNLITPILLSQCAINWLNKPGIILNIGSTFGAIGYPGYSSYCASKAGLHRFSEALNRELEGSGISVLYVAPRSTQTSINTDSVNQLNDALGNKSDSPDVVAKAVKHSLEKEITMKSLGWPERLFSKINQLFPGLVAYGIRKQQDKIHKYINKNNRDTL